jgi:hypothetical protein
MVFPQPVMILLIAIQASLPDATEVQELEIQELEVQEP